MKNIKITEFLMGLSAASMLIGLALLGLTLGNSLSTAIAVHEHRLLFPSIICMSAGALNLMLIVLSDASKLKSKIL